MNILILSVGTRNKIVQYFKNELNGYGIVIACDASELAPALYDADKYYIVPRLENENYFGTLKNICIENDVKCVFSLIDPELTFLSNHIDDFLSIGVRPIISDPEIIELCFDKYKFYSFLKDSGYDTIKTYNNLSDFKEEYKLGKISFPVFVKPVKGSASININIIWNIIELELIFKKFDNLLIQEFIEGKEYGIDVYIDIINETISAMFIKEKIKMRAGETDKSVSRKNNELENLIKRLLNDFQLKGIVDIDVFEKDNKYYISEINPRFGGGYPHAYECGINVPKMIVNNLRGIENPYYESNYENEVYMMKFSDIRLFKKNG